MALAVAAGFVAVGLIGGGIAGNQTKSDAVATPTPENKRTVDDAPADAATEAAETEAVETEDRTAEEPPVEPLDESVDAGSWADDRYGTFEEVNETGSGDSIISYDGTVPLSEGPLLITVHADGQWNLTSD